MKAGLEIGHLNLTVDYTLCLKYKMSFIKRQYQYTTLSTCTELEIRVYLATIDGVVNICYVMNFMTDSKLFGHLPTMTGI